jgi:uncharacterized protein
VEDHVTLRGAALRTPPYNLATSRLHDDAAAALAAGLRAGAVELPGVTGPAPDVDRFAAAWSDQRTCTMEQRVYRCSEVAAVPAASGRFRPAEPADAAILAAWMGPATARHLARGELFVWEDRVIVSMAAAIGATRHAIRVSGVFTPADLRGRGYATSCVAALTSHLLCTGRDFCFLYADAANPSTNRIYQRIGYRHVGDSRMWSFSAP